MKKVLLFATFFLAIHSHAQKVATFCEPSSKFQVEKYLENQGVELLSYLSLDNTIIFEGELSDLNNVCYTTELRTYKTYLSFPKNEIIIRIKKDEKSNFMQHLNQYPSLNVKKHDFIPYQYKISNVASNEADLFAFENELKAKNFTKTVQVNYQFTLSATSVNDPLFERQWAIKNNGTQMQGNGLAGADMNVDSAWSVTTGATNIKIAILDSGVDTLHEDLQANLLPGYDGFANDSSDTKGYPTPNFSSDAHGTACAGIAAAVGDNNLGTAGIAYTSKIVPVRIFYYQDFGGQIGVQPTTNTEALVNGSAYAWRVANADIFSISAGLDELAIFFMGVDTEIVEEELTEAYVNGRNGNSIAMFFSAGNDDVDNVLWPAKLSNTIAVGASTMCDERKNPNDCSTESWGSTYGENLDFVAPGVLIASSDLTGSLGYSSGNYTNSFNGTSAACPNAAGVGALILSVKPNLHARDIKAIISLTADKVDGYDYNQELLHGAWNEEMGYGRVNAYKAIQLAMIYESTVSISNATVTSLAIKVYPNPSNGKVTIESEENENFHVKVYSLNGQLISNQQDIEKETTLDLPRGFYFVEVGSQNKMDIRKLVVN